MLISTREHLSYTYFTKRIYFRLFVVFVSNKNGKITYKNIYLVTLAQLFHTIKYDFSI